MSSCLGVSVFETDLASVDFEVSQVHNSTFFTINSGILDCFVFASVLCGAKISNFKFVKSNGTPRPLAINNRASKLSQRLKQRMPLRLEY